MTYDFDLFVIGGGSGGVRAARLAAERGLNVGMAEGDRMGGTCVIRGCVPKKLMLYASEFRTLFALSKGYGWDIQPPKFQWETFRAKLENELQRLEDVYTGIMNKNNVRLFDAYAAIDGAHHITLDNGLRFSAERILIATGGRPFIPEFEGHEHVLVSDDIFHMETLPQSMLVVGGGYIACEFAGILHGLGVDVTQIYRGDLILRGYDHEMREILSSEMTRRGINLKTETDLEKVEALENGDKRVTFKNGDQITVSEVLMATGRVPNTEALNLASANITLKKGYISVDEYSQTSTPSIYAIGDVTGRAALTPIAIREGANFIETVYNSNPSHIDYSLIPTAIFTRPEAGTIGLSEEKAAELGMSYKIYSTNFRPMLSSFAGEESRMFMKLVVEQNTEKVLGVHILGDGAGEMIQLAAIAVTMGATKTQFDQTIAVHPTASEELVTLKEPNRLSTS